jgi:ParB-like chromosome segregation protein Spo0J
MSKKKTAPKETRLQTIQAKRIVTLKRNPQYLTPKQMESLKASIRRDGFCAPILVRPYKRDRFEVISGNHRFMAACELGLSDIPCVVSDMTDAAAKRLAINLNTIHGEPNAELLAPFLAELDIDILGEIHIEDSVKKELMDFDKTLAETLARLEAPDQIDRESPKHSTATCKCPACGGKHVKAKA